MKNLQIFYSHEKLLTHSLITHYNKLLELTQNSDDFKIIFTYK